MVLPMRIDGSNLLLAAQAQPQRPSAAKAQPQPAFEPRDFAKPSPTSERGQASPPGAVPRPGSQLDIKV